MDGLSSALARLWANTTELTPEQMAARLTNKAVGHLVWALVLITLGLIAYYTWPTWREVRRRLRELRAAVSRASCCCDCSHPHLRTRCPVRRCTSRRV